jgi:hypothetical protein
MSGEEFGQCPRVATRHAVLAVSSEIACMPEFAQWAQNPGCSRSREQTLSAAAQNKIGAAQRGEMGNGEGEDETA